MEDWIKRMFTVAVAVSDTHSALLRTTSIRDVIAPILSATHSDGRRRRLMDSTNTLFDAS